MALKSPIGGPLTLMLHLFTVRFRLMTPSPPDRARAPETRPQAAPTR